MGGESRSGKKIPRSTDHAGSNPAPGTKTFYTQRNRMNNSYEHDNSPITVGEIILLDFMKPYNITFADMVLYTGIPKSKMRDILYNDGKLTSEISANLAGLFGTSVTFWKNLQKSLKQ
jgi:addiction module HigA family antidote